MLPLYDRNPVSRTAWVTRGLIATNVLVFLWLIGHGTFGENRLVLEYGFVPCELGGDCVVQTNPARFGVDAVPPVLTIFTSMFLHGGWLHLLGNMLFLLVFGNNVEDRLGRGRFLIFYLLCGLLASLTQWAIGPSSEIPNIGASGAIAGVLGAYLVLFPFAWVITLVVVIPLPVPAFIVLGGWFVLQFLESGQQENVLGGGGVAYYAHIGGFLAGALLIGAFGGRRARRPPGRGQRDPRLVPS